MSQELEATSSSAELVVSEAEEQALAQNVKAKVDRKNLVLPLVKIGNGTTGEVKAGKGSPGDLINSVTGKNYGTSVDFIIADNFQGHFLRYESKAYVAQGPVAPDNWPPQYAGQAFVSLDDSEDNFAARANDPNDDQQWGSGPPINNTYNYVGYIVDEDFEAAAAENRLLPVRFSLMRGSTQAARVIDTLLTVWPTPWDRKVKISTISKASPEGPYFVAEAAEGDKVTTVERATAINLAQQIQNSKAKVELVGDDEADAKAAPPEQGDGLGL